jgi:lipase chaperone LimK
VSKRVAAIVLLVAALLAVWWLPRRGDNAIIEATTAPVDQRKDNAALVAAAPPLAEEILSGAEVATPQQFSPKAEPANDSLRGTQPDGAISFTDDQKLIVDLNLRRRFDYFLARIGEQPLATIRAALVQSLMDMSPAKTTQVLAAFDRYLRYLQDVALQPFQNAGLMPLRVVEELKIFRRARLGADMAKGFFALEEERDLYALAQWALTRREDLTQLERQRAAQELRAKVSAEFAAELTTAENAQTPGKVRDDVPAAAARQQALQQERANWDSRLAKYQAFMRTLSPADLPTRQSARAAYLRENFLPAEVRRIEALEAIGQLDASVRR